jgi:alpha-L-rhamnosidase
VRQGYTTTPEYWDVGAFSQNHCMMDHIEEWFYTHLAGIQNAGMAFDHIRIAPYMPKELKSLDVTTSCPLGNIRVCWQRSSDGITYRLTIPVGTVATVILPAYGSLWEDGQEVQASMSGITSIEYAQDKVTLTLGSGTYAFTTDDTKTSIKNLSTMDKQYKSHVYDLSGIPVSRPTKGKILITENRKSITL